VTTGAEAQNPVYTFTSQTGGFYKLNTSKAGVLTVYGPDMNQISTGAAAASVELYFARGMKYYLTLKMSEAGSYTVSMDSYTPPVIPSDGNLSVACSAGQGRFFTYTPAADGLHGIYFEGNDISNSAFILLFDTDNNYPQVKTYKAINAAYLNLPMEAGKTYGVYVFPFYNCEFKLHAQQIAAQPLTSNPETVNTQKDVWEYRSFRTNEEGWYEFSVEADTSSSNASNTRCSWTRLALC
jgi:hypothetical protein